MPVCDVELADRDQFASRGCVVLRSLIDPALTDYFWSYINTKFASVLMRSGDEMVPNTPASYGDPAFDGLLEYLRPRIERSAGCRLFPSYSYFRLYKHGDALKRHRDRPACEISVSLTIRQVPADPWALYIEGKTGTFGAILLPGDAVLYRGDCFHWRDRFEGERLAQVFLSYVDADGPHADWRFDRRKTLMRRQEADQSGNP